MKKFRILISLLVIILSLFQLCACAVRLPEPVEMSSADEANAMSFTKGSHKSEMSVGEYEFFKVKIKYDYEYLVTWSSSNTDVATVDSAGRVDAVSAGEVVITAKAKKATVDFPLTVKKAKTETLSKSTAITDNASTLEQNKLSSDNLNLYALLVNIESGCVTAYTYNNNGTYNVPVRAMACAVGSDMEEKNARIDYRQEWSLDNDNFYHFVTSFGEVRFSSTPYSAESSDSLITEEYNKLGKNSTDGNIWLSSADAEWIYTNCNDDTLVKLSSKAMMPLGVAKTLTLGENTKFKNWDPTDSDSNNPWNAEKPYFAGVEEVRITEGEDFDVHEGVTVFDSLSNPMDVYLDCKIDGKVNKDKAGTYLITYTCVDSLNRLGRADRLVHVVPVSE